MIDDFILFSKEAVEELKKVVWPSKAEVIDSTTVVIFVTCLVAFYLWVVDLGLQRILSSVIG